MRLSTRAVEQNGIASIEFYVTDTDQPIASVSKSVIKDVSEIHGIDVIEEIVKAIINESKCQLLDLTDEEISFIRTTLED
jgi:hypothetical protein